MVDGETVYANLLMLSALHEQMVFVKMVISFVCKLATLNTGVDIT